MRRYADAGFNWFAPFPGRADDIAGLAVSAGAGAASVLAVAGDAWGDRAGGTSGALWGLALRTWSGCWPSSWTRPFGPATRPSKAS